MAIADERNAHVTQQERFRRITAGLDSLPRLTRAAYLMHRLDDLPYEDVGRRCGITVDEVMLRVADALYAINRAVDEDISLMGHVRRRLLPWRAAWMQRRLLQRHRRLGLQ